jgi:uncharacterized protein (TIGR03067 family)
VLCYLEGKTNEEAARLLGWSKGTVSGRLARARDLLRPRLARRGLTLPAGALVALLAGEAPAPAALVELTIKAVRAGGASSAATALAQGVIKAMFVTQATKWAAVVTVAGLVTAGAGAVWQYAPAAGEQPRRTAPGAGGDQSPKAKPGLLFDLPAEPKKEPDDLRQLQGAWKAVALEQNGEKLSAEAVAKFRVAIRDNAITFDADGKKREAAFMLGTTNKPKAIWLKPSGKGPMVQGIYALDLGRLTICVDNDEGKAAPTEFATKPGSGLTLMVLEREEPRRAADGRKEGQARLALDCGSAVNAIKYSPDGRTLVASCADGRAQLWDVASGRLRSTLGGEGRPARVLAVSPDGAWVAVGGEVKGDQSGGVVLFEAGTGREVLKFDLPTKAVRGLAFSPDGKRLALSGDDSRVSVWDVKSGREVAALVAAAKEPSVSALAYSPDGKLLVSAAGPKVRLWDAATGKELRVVDGARGEVESLAFSPDGRLLLTAGRDQPVRVWDLASGKQEHGLGGERVRIDAAAFSPDGKLIAWGDANGSVRLYDLATRKVVTSFQGGAAVRALAFSPDGKALASGGADGKAYLWDVAK